MKSKLFKILGVVAVVAMMASALVAPVNAMTNVNLAESDTTIGIVPATIDVTFTLGATQVASATGIVITFDSGWTVAAIPTAKISTSNGIGTIAISSISITDSAVGQVVTLDTTSAGVGNIGAGAIVQIEFTAGITNPGTVGNFGCTVKTAAETTAIASSQILTKVPTIPPVAGVATVFNSAGIQLTQSNDLIAAINAVTTGGTIKLSAGTYNTNFSTATNLGGNFTIQGTDASAANVILKSTAAWALSGKTVVIDSVTIDNTNALTVGNSISGGATTVSNSNITKGALITTGTSTVTISKDTFTVATGAVGLNAPVATTVTGCTFNVAGTGTGITGAAKETISGSTFTGVVASSNNGVGIVLSAGTGSTVTTSTFTGLNSALVVSGAAVSFNGNTVTSCGLTAGPDAIMTTSTTGTGVFILNNKITNSLEYIVNNSANDSLVVVMDNTFSGNVKNANNTDATIAKMNVTHNSWGATAPASTSSVDYSNPLGSVPTSSNFATGVSGMTLDATATAGVNVTASTGATVIGAAALTGNPVTPTIASTNTVVKYFDVFGNGTTGATIDFYGTTASPVTANSQIYFYNSTFGTWQACSAQTINTYGNYVEVTIGAGTAPTATQFNGLPFALVTVPLVLPSVVPPASVVAPVNGAVNVPISNLTFTWPAVVTPGATYQFALAQASANTSANEFAILDYSDNTSTNAEPSQETLQYNTVYWWEVRAVTMNSSGGIAATGPWTVSMFTTALAPVTTTGTGAVTTVVTSVVITNPVTTVVSTQTSVVITQATGTSGPAIPSYLLWAVIAVGAVLIIAVIVLIVRTRRIP